MLTDLKDSGGVLGELNLFHIFGLQPWLLVYGTRVFVALCERMTKSATYEPTDSLPQRL